MYKAGKAYLTPYGSQTEGQEPKFHTGNRHTFCDNWCKIDCHDEEQVKALFHIECCYSLNDIPLIFKRKLHKQLL